MSDGGCDVIMHDGGPVCGAVFHADELGDTRMYRCTRGHCRSERYLALHQLGPYALKREPAAERAAIPGFRWNAQEQCYTRIASDDEIAQKIVEDMRRWHAKGKPGW